MAPKFSKVAKKPAMSLTTVKKRPAGRLSLKARCCETEWSEKEFQLKAFCKTLWQKNGLRKKDGFPPLTIATSCSGVGTVVHVLNEMLGKENVTEIFAVERDPAAAAFYLKNFSPDHLFQERD